MSSKIIIIATVVLLIASFSVLFVVESKNHDPDFNKAWSVVYFENPRDDSLDFAIENHEGEKANYDYRILIGGKSVFESRIEIEAGAKQKISPVIPSERLKDSQVLIEADYKDTEHRIYKNLGK